MPHCYAHPTLYSTQQLFVPVKLTFHKETGILKQWTQLHMWQCQDLMIETGKWNQLLHHCNWSMGFEKSWLKKMLM